MTHAPLLRVAFALIGPFLTASPVYAQTIRVGPGEAFTTVASAAAAATDGARVEIMAGTYREEVVWTRDRLAIVGIGRVIFDATGLTLVNQGGKGIFILDGADTSVENVEFIGAEISDDQGANAAGIRWQGEGSLSVRSCIFRDNQNGILGGNHASNTALIERSEFVGNGRGRVGYTHNLYINEIDSLTFRANWTHALWSGGGDIGHLLKSRARRNYILYNRITAEDGPSSYEINLPQGGESYLIGNLIEQAAGGQRTMVSYADGDGAPHPDSRLFVSHNTIVNDSSGSATFIRTTLASAEIRIVNNLVVGSGTLVSGGATTMSNNVLSDAPHFVNRNSYDYRLTAGSPAIDAGALAGSVGGTSLEPTDEYVQPRMLATRPSVGAPDVGAYEFGTTNASIDGGSATGPADAGQDRDGAIPQLDASSTAVGTRPSDGGTNRDARATTADADGTDAAAAGTINTVGGCAIGPRREHHVAGWLGAGALLLGLIARLRRQRVSHGGSTE